MSLVEMCHLLYFASFIQSAHVWLWHPNYIVSKVSYTHTSSFPSNLTFNRAVESTSNNTRGRTSKVALLTKVHFSKVAELPHYYFGETAPPQGFDAVGELHLPTGVIRLILQSAGGSSTKWDAGLRLR